MTPLAQHLADRWQVLAAKAETLAALQQAEAAKAETVVVMTGQLHFLEIMQHGPSPYLTAPEAARYLRVTTKALYNLVDRGRLKPLSGHRHYRFTQEQLENFLTLDYSGEK